MRLEELNPPYEGIDAERIAQWVPPDAEVELTTLLLETELSIGDFLQLRPGDVIPVPMPELTTVFAEDVPIFRGRYGQAHGHKAVRFQAPAGRREARLHGDFSTEHTPS